MQKLTHDVTLRRGTNTTVKDFRWFKQLQQIQETRFLPPEFTDDKFGVLKVKSPVIKDYVRPLRCPAPPPKEETNNKETTLIALT